LNFHNLTVVHYGSAVFLGIRLPDSTDMPSGAIKLKGAVQLIVNRHVTDTGIREAVMPTWILPHPGPAEITIPHGIVHDCSNDASMGNMYGQAAGVSAVLRPATGLVQKR